MVFLFGSENTIFFIHFFFSNNFTGIKRLKKNKIQNPYGISKGMNSEEEQRSLNSQKSSVKESIFYYTLNFYIS